MEDKPPITGVALYILTFALCLGTFIQVLDMTISVVAVPYIAGGLGVSPNQGSWVITSFAVSNAIMLPLTGWMSKQLGEVKLFVLATSLFSITSFLCGMAWSLTTIVIFRIIQGAVAGSLIPLSQSLMIKNYPEEKRGLAIGVWSMIIVVAPVVGPIVGGYLTETYGWPWIFYVNVPLGFLAGFLCWEILRERESTIEKHPIDFTAFLMLIIAISSLQIVLDRGQQDDWFNSPIITTLVITAFLGTIIFIVWNNYSSDPIIDFKYFYDRNFTLSTLSAAGGFMFLFGSIVITPLWLQTAMGYTALWSGIAIAPLGVIPIFLSPFVGKYMHKIDLRLLATLAYLVFSGTFFWMTYGNPQISVGQIMLPRFVQGFSITLFIIPLLSMALVNIPKSEVTSATGVYMFIRFFAGGGIGTSLFVTLYTRRQAFHHSNLVQNVNFANPATPEMYRLLQSYGIDGLPSHAFVNTIVDQQAAMLALNDLFWMSAWGYLAIIPLLWLCKNHGKEQGHVPHAEVRAVEG